MKHTECKDCKLSNGDCGYHFKMNGITNYDIASLTACDKYNNCMFFQPKEDLNRGHWQVIGYHADKYFYCKCSNCQKKTKVFYDKTNPGEFGSLADIKRNVNFCMFCGADMREGREDET